MISTLHPLLATLQPNLQDRSPWTHHYHQQSSVNLYINMSSIHPKKNKILLNIYKKEKEKIQTSSRPDIFLSRALSEHCPLLPSNLPSLKMVHLMINPFCSFLSRIVASFCVRIFLLGFNIHNPICSSPPVSTVLWNLKCSFLND